MIDDTTHSAASSSEPTSGGAHIHLLLPDGENRRLLEEWLGQRYAVTTGTTAASLDREFDLCLITQATFAHYTQELIQRKDRAAPTFLPYLLLLDEHSAATVESRVWEHVDEVVTTPIQKRELQGRLSGLPRRRPRPPRAASKARPRLPVRVLVDSEREAVARVDRPVGHDLLGVVHDQEEIGELVTGAVVVQERRHEQRVVLQARVRVVDALVEPARYVRREPRPMASPQGWSPSAGR